MKYLILGGGVAGLTLANVLKKRHETSFLLLEQEQEVGGLCRSTEVDGAPLDIGGGHFLDVRRPKVNEFLFEFMPREEWNKYIRDSRIYIKGQEISHPIEANIWQLDAKTQEEYLRSIAQAGCNTGKPCPTGFVDWIYWKLGERIAEDYMLPYNRKLYSSGLNELGTYWLEKLPGVSYEDTLLSCRTGRTHADQPGHAEFYYPKKFGSGELWRRMGENIKNNTELGKKVRSIDFENKIVTDHDGGKYRADVIITTIPWAETEKNSDMPEDIRAEVGRLRHNSLQIQYRPERIDTKAQWIYCPDENEFYHRILVRHNFCPNSRGHWLETNGERLNMEEENNNFKYLNKYAYPLNTIDKPHAIKRILSYGAEKGVYGLGRWGEHSHYNSDLTAQLAMEMADKLPHLR